MLFGQFVLASILRVAQLLVTDNAPGWVAAVLFVSLLVVIAWSGAQIWRRIQAVRTLGARVRTFRDAQDFAQHFDTFNAELVGWKNGSHPRATLFDAWQEYAETTVIDSRDGQDIRRNAVRPSSFLNVEDLGFGPGWFRIVPGLFVSLGLLCTFLGLVAALSSLGTRLGLGAKPEDVVISLMTIASAKFVMSLAGLACSIVFSLVLRISQSALDRALHDLCRAIEQKLSFVSLEDIAFRQLEATIEQREAFRKIGMELVADLKRPLDDLPAEISKSIGTAMEPMFQKVGQIGASGMEGIVDGLSSQISGSVGLALTRASDALKEASDRIGQMVDRMNASSAQMGEGMQTALGQMASAIANLRTQVAASGETASNTMTQGADRLLAVMNETLQGIRDNTAEGAEALRTAATDMRAAAHGFRTELEAATEKGGAAVSEQMDC